jgi:hypothetical protein
MQTEKTFEELCAEINALADTRQPAVTTSLHMLRVTHEGALALPTSAAALSEHARQHLAEWLEMSTDAVPTDGDTAATQRVNARRRCARGHVCIRLVRGPDALLARDIVEVGRPIVNERLLASTLGLLGAGNQRTGYVVRGAEHVFVAVRCGRCFDAGGRSHEHGLALSLDERGVLIVFAAVFIGTTSALVLRMVHAVGADVPPAALANLIDGTRAGELTREDQVRSALAEPAPRASLIVEVFLDHPAVPVDYLFRVRRRMLERDAATRFDVVEAMLADADTLDLEGQIAVSSRAGEVLLLDD